MANRFDISGELPDEHISRLLHLAADAYDERNCDLTIEAGETALEAVREVMKQRQDIRVKVLNQIAYADEHKRKVAGIR